MKNHFFFLPTYCLILLLLSCGRDNEDPIIHDPNPVLPGDSAQVLTQRLNHPWEILWGPDNYIWMTERNGRISRVNPETGAVLPLLTIPDVKASGEGGLLGMALHPDFGSQPHVFVVYNYDKSGTYREKVVRYTYQQNTLSSPVVLLDNLNASSIHNGSRLLVTTDGKLWITTGDANRQNDAQQTQVPNGKVLRINTDGSIPADNPFPSNPVWSFGHRNPQGLVLVNNILYTSEHGPNIEDEVNIIEKKRNYGWPIVNGPCDQPSETAFCNSNQVKTPIWSSGGVTVATSGLDYYNHDRIAAWKHSLLMATLKDNKLYQLKLSADGRTITGVSTFFNGRYGRLRDVCVSPAGRVYICTGNGGNNDKLIVVGKI